MRMLKQYRGIWYQMETDLLDAPFDTALRPSSYPRTASMDKYNESQIASCKHLRHSITILQNRGQFFTNMQYNEVPEGLIPEDDKECAALPLRMWVPE